MMIFNNVKLKPFVVATALLSLSACSMAPKYERPASPVAQPLVSSADTAALNADGINAANIGWRDFYLDPQLQALIEQALSNNRDLRIATLTVEQVRAQYRIARAQQLPAFNATAAGTRQRVSADVSSTGESVITEQYSAGLGIAAFELDVFGRVQSLSKSALENYFATEAGQKSAQLSLVAQVADGYFAWQANKELLSLTENTQSARQQSYEVIKRRFDSGLSSELDLSQAASSLHSARIDAAQFQRQLEQSLTSLEVLIGGPLDTPRLQTPMAYGAQLSALPEALSSEVLLQRPDILQAEHRLKAANANIGAARAAFFPRVSLTGSYGSASRELDDLFGSGTRAWSFAPQINLPIFAWGANAANLDVANLQKDINIASYEQAIQVAFKEVRDNLQATQTLNRQLNAQEDLVKAVTRSFELASLRYEKGVDSYLDVLDAQRSLNSAQQALINTRMQKNRNQLTLYKVLGGGLLERAPQTNSVTQQASL